MPASVRTGLTAATLAAALALTAPARAEPGITEGPGIVTEIRFIGNDRTRERTMLQEMLVAPGDPVDAERIERSRQAIMDLELFQSVDTRLIPVPGGNILEVAVKEKHYTLALPILNRSADGDITWGGQLIMDNVSGLNQSLRLRYKDKDQSGGEVDRERSLSFEFDYPRIGGGPYAGRILLKHDNSDLDAEENGVTGRYERVTDVAELGISRWYHEGGPSRGWRLSGGVLYNDIEYSYLSGAKDLYRSGTVVALQGGVDYGNVHNFLYSREGKEYGYNLQIALPDIGSDISYTRHELYYRGYRHVGSRPHTNVNYQIRFATASTDLFGEQFYSLGGASNLRGYDRDDIEGNAFFNLNIEFLTPVFGQKALRGVAFMDLGNAYDGFSDVDLLDLNTSVGVGLRWVIKSFVKLQLRVDAAYAVDADQGKILAGTGATF